MDFSVSAQFYLASLPEGALRKSASKEMAKSDEKNIKYLYQTIAFSLIS